MSTHVETAAVVCCFCNVGTAGNHAWNCPRNPVRMQTGTPNCLHRNARQIYHCPDCGRELTKEQYEHLLKG